MLSNLWRHNMQGLEVVISSTSCAALLGIKTWFYAGRFRQMTEMRRLLGTFCPLKKDSSSFSISWVKLYLAWSLRGCEDNRNESHESTVKTSNSCILVFCFSQTQLGQRTMPESKFGKEVRKQCLSKSQIHKILGPQNVEGVSRQQQVQPFISGALLNQAHDTVRQQTQASNGATTELK